MEKKYILHPALRVSAVRLANLYGVSLHECIIVDRDISATRGYDLSKMIHLHVLPTDEYYAVVKEHLQELREKTHA